MLTFKIKREQILLPSSWGDLTCRQMQRLKSCKTFSEGFEVVTGYKVDNVPKNILTFFDWLTKDFDIAEIDTTTAFKFNDELHEIPNVREMQWGQKILACRLIRELKNDATMYSTFTKILAIYLQPIIFSNEFDEKKSTEFANVLMDHNFALVYGATQNIIKQLNDVVEMENRNLSEKPDPLSEQAGIERLRKLGEINDIDILAHGKVWMWETVLKIDYNTAYVKLLHIKEKRNFDKNYRQLKKQSNNG